jgi:hypothetical protein
MAAKNVCYRCCIPLTGTKVHATAEDCLAVLVPRYTMSVRAEKKMRGQLDTALRNWEKWKRQCLFVENQLAKWANSGSAKDRESRVDASLEKLLTDSRIDSERIGKLEQQVKFLMTRIEQLGSMVPMKPVRRAS